MEIDFSELNHVENKITICGSLHEENTFYIFRDSGVEVKIQIVDKTIYTSHPLTEMEREYLKNNILTNGKT